MSDELALLAEVRRLDRELAAERAAHLATRQELSRALAERDHWRVRHEATDASYAASCSLSQTFRVERDAIVGDLARLFDWSDKSYAHAVTHVDNAVQNLRADLAVERAEVERLTRDLATAQSLLARTLGPDLDMVACMSVLLDASRAEVERLKARGEASWGHLTRLNAEWQEVYTATCDEALRLSAEVERLRADIDTLARRDATYWTQHCNAERKVEQLRAEKTLWQATLRETVATQKRERDAALESLRERCAAYAHDWVSDNVDSHVAAEAQAAIRAVPLAWTEARGGLTVRDGAATCTHCHDTDARVDCRACGTTGLADEADVRKSS